MDIEEMKKRFRAYGVSQERVAEMIGLPPALLSWIFSNKVRETQEQKY